MTPPTGTHSPPTPFQEPIQVEVAADGKEGLQESSGPEDRETPQGSPSVLTSVESLPADQGRSRWSRQQKRVFHRTLACFSYWQGHGFQVLWVMLTSSLSSPKGTLAAHHAALRRAVEREYGYRGIEHCTVETREGNGVLHIVWAWNGEGSFYIPQEWLSRKWAKIHGATYVWIARVRKGQGSGARISRYMVSQYVAKQGALVRLSWSWKTFRLSIVKTWQEFRRAFRGRLGKAGMGLWRSFLEGKPAPLPDGSTWELEYVRANGPPDLTTGRRWALGNDGEPTKPCHSPVTIFEVGGRLWQTIGPAFQWAPCEA
jgi:hypothetical protein